MKKLIVGFVAITAVMIANAQGKGKLTYGIKAGINVSTLGTELNDATATAGSKIGFNGGVFIELPIAANFTIQPEALYSQMGTKLDEMKLNFDYVNIPVLVKYNSGGLAVYAGPQLGILASAKSKSDGESEDIKDDLKSIDFAGIFGTEYAFNCGVIFSARYQLGLSNIAENEDIGSKLKNHGFNFTIGYRFSGKKK